MLDTVAEVVRHSLVNDELYVHFHREFLHVSNVCVHDEDVDVVVVDEDDTIAMIEMSVYLQLMIVDVSNDYYYVMFVALFRYYLPVHHQTKVDVE